MQRIDLRSDTVTQPSEGMRAAMARALVGDDQYGEDPTIILLQERVAALLGKEASLFVPSGTMANQIGMRLLTRPGDDVVVGAESHVVWHESGASAANAGIQFSVAGQRGTFDAAALREVYKAPGHVVFPPTTLVALENTHNRGGGIVFPQGDIIEICAAARELGIGSYLDGARLFNASVASGRSLAEMAAPFDVVSVALSKGLACPVGSMIAGTADAMRRAVRIRRMFGGAMRQAGILAAAGLYALDQGFDHLAADHANARTIAQTEADIDMATVQTNIVIFRLPPHLPDAMTVVRRAGEQGVLLGAFAARTIRATTHCDVSAEQCRRAGKVLASILMS
jgi:threonine aldolase